MDIPYSRGRTNTGAAIRYMREEMFSNNNGQRDDAANIAVIVTDGASNNKEATLAQAFLAKKQAIHIIVISLGSWIDREELIGMATFPYQKNLISIANVNELDDMKTKLRELVCNSMYTNSYHGYIVISIQALPYVFIDIQSAFKNKSLC